MGNNLSTVHYLAPASFLFDFAAQQYGMFSSPNMLDIHNRNPAAFSPYPYAIAGFFFPQQLFQVAWLWKLCRREGTAKEQAMMERFAWVYSLGNVCIGTWMFFWNADNLATANVFVIINTVAQLAYISTALEPLDTRSTPNWLTHVVAKTFAGIGVLDLLHNTSAAYYRGVAPSGLVQIATGVGFAAVASVSDWIFGGCLVYDLAALAVGQAGSSWGSLLGAYAAMTAGIVGFRNYV
ncbi:hypothetical protein C7974DRAFT_395545 [Boeremia exigua]|uniref:uncharacterized protein n=1 Tax=Boeremia exigua TaxID=749465 RepID=UPI001E8D9177|nr:uncharacterized protein C7974DRAFT_395545 [Boeremia exigua]KAH6625167.1 hypothetical protein C7974DRAFT_395545 [Boeremia exigua]